MQAFFFASMLVYSLLLSHFISFFYFTECMELNPLTALISGVFSKLIGSLLSKLQFKQKHFNLVSQTVQ